MAIKRKSVVYRESDTEPGVYEYRSDRIEVIKQSDARLWNVKAVEKLDQMYERLGVPQKWRW